MRITSLDKDLVDFVPVLDTNVLANNEIFMQLQQVPNVFLGPQVTRKLVSVTALDGDDQNVSFDLVFGGAAGSLGTINSTVTISDADAKELFGHVAMVPATNGKDMINSWLFTQACSIMVKGALYVGGIVRSGTPTFTASGMKLRLGFE